MTCPFLEYRRSSGERTFDHERPFCTAAEEFVQPMRADICNGRYGLAHERDCEIYLAHATEESPETDGGRDPGSTSRDGRSAEGDVDEREDGERGA